MCFLVIKNKSLNQNLIHTFNKIVWELYEPRNAKNKKILTH
jgi:hypothetical protein